jgi:hypothetical protein
VHYSSITGDVAPVACAMDTAFFTHHKQTVLLKWCKGTTAAMYVRAHNSVIVHVDTGG